VRKASREIYLLALNRSPRVASSGAKGEHSFSLGVRVE